MDVSDLALCIRDWRGGLRRALSSLQTTTGSGYNREVGYLGHAVSE